MIHSREGFVFINDGHLTFLKSIFLFPPRLATVAHSEEKLPGRTPPPGPPVREKGLLLLLLLFCVFFFLSRLLLLSLSFVSVPPSLLFLTLSVSLPFFLNLCIVSLSLSLSLSLRSLIFPSRCLVLDWFLFFDPFSIRALMFVFSPFSGFIYFLSCILANFVAGHV